MLAQELINPHIRPLASTDDAVKAIVALEEMRCHHLPVLDDGRLRGFVSEEILMSSSYLKKQLRDYDLEGALCFVHPSAHYLDAMKAIGKHRIQTVAVVDDERRYVGAIFGYDIMAMLSGQPAVQQSGAILALSIPQRDYSLAKICQCAEENNARVLFSSVADDPSDADKMILFIKINVAETRQVAATLERFGYAVIARFQEGGEEGRGKERYDLLMKYLDL